MVVTDVTRWRMISTPIVGPQRWLGQAAPGRQPIEAEVLADFLNAFDPGCALSNMIADLPALPRNKAALRPATPAPTDDRVHDTFHFYYLALNLVRAASIDPPRSCATSNVTNKREDYDCPGGCFVDPA